MSLGIDKRELAIIKKCPDCNKNNLIIYTDGACHCGYCLMGGMINAKKYRHFLKDKEIIEKVNNEYVFNTMLCKRCEGIIEEYPCRWCKYCGGNCPEC